MWLLFMLLTFVVSCSFAEGKISLENSEVLRVKVNEDCGLVNVNVNNETFLLERSPNSWKLIKGEGDTAIFSFDHFKPWYIGVESPLRVRFATYAVSENMDSIVLLTQDSLFLFSKSHGEPLKWSSNQIMDWPEDLVFYMFPYSQPIMRGKRLIIPVFRHGVSENEYEVSDVFLRIDNDNIIFDGIAAYFPVKKENSEMFYPLNQVSRVWVDEFLVCSYGQSGDIFVFKEGALVNKVSVPSKYIEQHHPITLVEFSDMTRYRQYLTEEGQYLDLKYDKRNRLYYREAIHPVSFENEEGELATHEDKNWSVIVFDEKFRIIDEKVFMQADYAPVAFPVPEGFAVLKKGFPKVENDNKLFEYDIFKLEKK